MATLDVKKLKITCRPLHVPSLNEIKTVLEEGLSTNFAEVKVEVVNCPDLTKEPFLLSASGLSGNPTIFEIGGPSYLLPIVQKDKLYDIHELLKHINYSDKSFVIGAGAGPWPYINSNCELMMNLVISSSGIKNETRIASVDKSSGNCKLETLNDNETRLALLANLFISKGETGSVLKVHVKRRTGKDDFVACMQKALAHHYKDKLVGFGGTFLINEGKVKQHVMPDFSSIPLDNVQQLDDWLNFYNMSTPLVAVGTFVSSETDLDLRVQHFHSFSHHGEGGHYHIDTTPETIEYLGYFNLGNNLYRIDQPAKSLKFGKD